MLRQRRFELTDPSALRAVIDANPWASLTTWSPERGLVVSHLPVLVEPADDRAADRLAVLGHLARTDAELHQLGDQDGVLVVQGPHGYVSPSFYVSGPYVPTWNFVVVHAHGRPQRLSDEETYHVLDQTVDRLERDRPKPWRLSMVAEYAQRIASGTVGFRLAPDRIVGKAKLSQDKPTADVDSVITALEQDPVHANPALAVAMRAVAVTR